jgi:predicted MPP superfamily phosphohydrolase
VCNHDDLAGIGLATSTGSTALDSAGQLDRAALLLQEQRRASARIFLTHVPDTLARLHGRGVDLVVAGHTHGGQVQLPGFGPLFTFSAMPRSVAGGGLSRVEDTLLYVSRGVGLERGRAPGIRLFCRPEISLIELVRCQPTVVSHMPARRNDPCLLRPRSSLSQSSRH